VQIFHEDPYKLCTVKYVGSVSYASLLARASGEELAGDASRKCDLFVIASSEWLPESQSNRGGQRASACEHHNDDPGWQFQERQREKAEERNADICRRMNGIRPKRVIERRAK
jgi:hypothetical protein